jgi:hypothetical protein
LAKYAARAFDSALCWTAGYYVLTPMPAATPFLILSEKRMYSMSSGTVEIMIPAANGPY